MVSPRIPIQRLEQQSLPRVNCDAAVAISIADTDFVDYYKYPQIWQSYAIKGQKDHEAKYCVKRIFVTVLGFAKIIDLLLFLRFQLQYAMRPGFYYRSAQRAGLQKNHKRGCSIRVPCIQPYASRLRLPSR